MIDQTNANASSISQTISDATSNVGYTITEQMKDIWTVSDNITNSMNTNSSNLNSSISTVGTNINNVVSAYGNNFQNISSSTNSTVVGIKGLVQQLVDDANKRREAEEAARKAAEAAQKAAQEAQRKAQEAAAQKSAQAALAATSSGGGSSYGGGGGNSGGSSGGGSAWGSWFIHKDDSFPKNRLRIDTSIVDRLKYNSIDSSFSARAGYYSAMGGSGGYTGSASQNTWIINELRNHGYRKGTQSATQGLHLVNEDGMESAVLKGKLVDFSGGETVFNGDMTSKLWDFAKDPTSFLQNLSPVMPKFTNTNTSSSVDVGGVNFNIEMNGVNDVNEFAKQVRGVVADDVKLQKMLKMMLFRESIEFKKYK